MASPNPTKTSAKTLLLDLRAVLAQTTKDIDSDPIILTARSSTARTSLSVATPNNANIEPFRSSAVGRNGKVTSSEPFSLDQSQNAPELSRKSEKSETPPRRSETLSLMPIQRVALPKFQNLKRDTPPLLSEKKSSLRDHTTSTANGKTVTVVQAKTEEHDRDGSGDHALTKEASDAMSFVSFGAPHSTGSEGPTPVGPFPTEPFLEIVPPCPPLAPAVAPAILELRQKRLNLVPAPKNIRFQSEEVVTLQEEEPDAELPPSAFSSSMTSVDSFIEDPVNSTMTSSDPVKQPKAPLMVAGCRVIEVGHGRIRNATVQKSDEFVRCKAMSINLKQVFHYELPDVKGGSEMSTKKILVIAGASFALCAVAAIIVGVLYAVKVIQ